MLWTEGTEPSIQAPVYVRQADLPALEEALQEADCWPQVIQVLPNGEEPLPLIAFLLSLEASTPLLWAQAPDRACQLCQMKPPATDRAPAHKDYMHQLGQRIAYRDKLLGTPINAVSAEYRGLLNTAVDVLLALQCMDAPALISASVTLEKEAQAQLDQRKSRAHPQTPALARWFARLGEQLVLPMSQGIISEQGEVTRSCRNWWNTASPLIDRCQRLRTALRQVDPTLQTLPVLRVLDRWLDGLAKQLGHLKLQVGAELNQRAEALLTASAWFTACALRNMELGLSAKGLLMLHRASEWLLMAKVVERGLIAFDTTGGRYLNPQHYGLKNDQPGFANHLTVLIQLNEIVFHQSEKLLRDLNEWRNVHPLTHHMGAPTMPAAETVFYGLLKHLPRLADAALWDQSLAAFALTPELALADLLDPDGLLRGSVMM